MSAARAALVALLRMPRILLFSQAMIILLVWSNVLWGPALHWSGNPALLIFAITVVLIQCPLPAMHLRGLVDGANERLMPDVLGAHLRLVVPAVLVLQVAPFALLALHCGLDPLQAEMLLTSVILLAWISGWEMQEWSRQLQAGRLRNLAWLVLPFGLVLLILANAVQDSSHSVGHLLLRHLQRRADGTEIAAMLGLTALLFGILALRVRAVGSPGPADPWQPSAEAGTRLLDSLRGGPTRGPITSTWSWIRHAACGWFPLQASWWLALCSALLALMVGAALHHYHEDALIVPGLGGMLLLWIATSLIQTATFACIVRQESMRPVSRRHFAWLALAGFGFFTARMLLTILVGQGIALLALSLAGVQVPWSGCISVLTLVLGMSSLLTTLCCFTSSYGRTPMLVIMLPASQVVVLLPAFDLDAVLHGLHQPSELMLLLGVLTIGSVILVAASVHRWRTLELA